MTGPMASLRDFNRRSNEWGERHPWFLGALFGAALGGGQVAAVLMFGRSVRWSMHATAAGAAFLVLGTGGWLKARYRAQKWPFR